MFNRLRDQVSQFIAPRGTRPMRAQIDPNAPIALYYHPSGKVTPVTIRSFTNGGYNALNASMSRTSSATASEIGYAYLSEVNVWIRRCMEIRADNIQRLEWYVENKITGKRIPDHALTRAMDRTRHPLMWAVMRAMDTWGEVYIKPLENVHKVYSDVWWLNNLSVNFNVVNGYIDQFYYVPTQGGKPFVWPVDKMCYIYNFNSFDTLRGSSRVLAVLHEANVHEEIARAAQAHFANDARPGLMFLPENDLGPGPAQEFMDYWKANFQGSVNANKPVLLPMAIKSVQVLERASLKDDVELRGSIRREICAGFGVPLSVAGAWDDANYQSAPEQRKSLYEETIIPQAELLARGLTTELLPFFGDPVRERVWFDAKKLLALAEDKQAKATALNSQLLSGGITLNQYREAMDQEAIPQGNVFYVPTGVTVTPVEKLGSMPPPAAPGGFGFASAPDIPPPPPVPQLPPSTPSTSEAPAKAAGSLNIHLSLANDAGLTQLQNQLKPRMNDPSIQWTDPADFHITLVHVPSLGEGQVDDLLSYQVDAGPGLTLNVGSLASFDKVGRHALFFRIRENAALRACQRDLYQSCKDAGMQISPFNTSEGWQPHVTMGYSSQPIRRVKVDTGLSVKPSELIVSVESDGTREDIYRMPLAAITPDPISEQPNPVAAAKMDHPAPAVNPFLDELNAYEKFTLNRWGKPLRAFQFNAITDPLMTELADQVSACTSKDQVKRLFEGLRAALKKTNDEPDIVTFEQAQEWWGDYDRLMKTLGNDWLRDYMKEIWRKLEGRLSRDISVETVGDLLNDFHPDLIKKWTGTAEEPGVIAKLFMAGMGAGQQALERKRTNMNPAKAAELNIDWTLVPSDAIASVEKYVGQLIKGIDATTLAEVQHIIAQWLESGGTIADLAEQLNPIFNDPARARLIAQTESSTAYNRGAVQRWQDAGVMQMKFKTVQDARVCAQCSGLAGDIGTLEDGWDGVFIPVHGGCRCYASPVL